VLTVSDAGAPASPTVSFDALEPGAALGPMAITISAGANERYFAAAGADHPRLRAGALYPPIAANLTVLVFQQTCADPVIQTRQRLRCSGHLRAGTPLVVTGAVADRYDKRGRPYVDVVVHVAAAAEPDRTVWTSEVSFTPAATLGATP
jgi:hypothetical protein